MYATLFAHFVLLTPVFWLSLHVFILGGRERAFARAGRLFLNRSMASEAVRVI